MAINFPDSPSNGDTFTANGVVYTYNATQTLWKTSSAGGGSSVTVSDTAPTSPSDGDMWYNSLSLKMFVYYNDGSSSQWVPASPQQAGADGATGPAGADGSATSYANLAAFPSSGNTAGDFGFATDTKSSYMWDGVAWQRMSIGSQIGPRYTTIPPATHSLNNDGVTATTITTAAIDESGFPITYDWDAYSGSTLYNASSLPPQVTSISESNGVFSLVGSSSESNAGSFVFRSKASDGVLFTPAITAVTLDFFPQPSNLVARHEIADISGSTWSDSSGNSVDLTIAGTGSSGGYNSSGDLGEPVLELAGGSTGKYLSYGAGDLSTAKTFMIIFQPTNTSADNMVISTGSNTWNGLSKSGDPASPTSLTAWSGTSASVILNGAAMASRATLYNDYVGNKFNSVASRNYAFGTSTYVIQGYTNNLYNTGMAVKAIYAWSVALTDAELQSVHNMQSQMVTWST